MPRLLILPLVLLILALGAAACDSGGGEVGSPTPRPSATAGTSPTAAASATSTAVAPVTPTTPPGSATATPTVKPTPTSTGTRIQPPEDLAKFLDKYKDKQITSQNCDLDHALGEANCGDHGRYALDPVPEDASATCDVRLVDGKPIAVVCSSHEPLTVTYYEVPS